MDPLWAGVVLSLVFGAGSLLYTRRGARATERQANAADVGDEIARRDEAREEAIALAKTRKQVIGDLEDRISHIELEQTRERADCAKQVADLKHIILEVREESAETVRALAVGFRGALVKILGHLEHEPPETEQAIAFLRDSLNGDAPPRPFRVRRDRAA